MMRKAFTLLLLIWNFAAFSQDDVITQADYAFDHEQYARAYDLYGQASELYQAANEFELYVLCNLKMAQCHLETGAFDQVNTQCNNICEYLKEVLPESPGLLVSTLLLQAESQLKLGRYDQMLETLSQAEHTLKDPESLLAAECYNDLGVAYWNNGNKETAKAYHERALNIRQSNLNANDPLIADSYLNLGLISLDDDNRQAISYFKSAEEVYEQAFGANSPQVALCYSNLAFANSNQKNYAGALQFLDKTMEIWNSNFLGDHANKAFTLSNRGRILEAQGNYDQALLMEQQALQMYLRLYGDKHPEVANTHFLIGSVQMKIEQYRDAVESFQKSIYANLFDQTATDEYALPELRDYYSADILLSSLQYKGQALEALHFEKSLSPKDIKAALNTYLKCDDLISIIRQRRLTEADKIKIGQIAAEVYDNGIRISLYLSEKTFHPELYRETAFIFCERSKSAVLLEAIGETKAKSFAGIPDELIAYEDSLKSEISWLEQQLAASPKEPKLTDLKDQLFKIQQSYRDFVVKLEQDYPSYFNLKYRKEDIDITQLQNELGSNKALLSYYIGKNTIYVFTVTQGKLEINQKPKSDNLLQQTKGLRNGIKYGIQTAFEKSAIELYKQLIPDIPGDVQQLIIIPDGILGTIPFETLIEPNAEQKTYLLEKYAIAYNYAASLLLDKQQMQTSNSKGILLTAPVSFENNETHMDELPGTEQEVREIKYLFLSSPDKPEVLLKKNASESVLKSDQLANYKYLHFATHGVVDEARPELSRIFVSPGEDEDGSLYSGEIYGLKIGADLVTLSACETGLGKVEKGEGIIGLSRSLMYAGAKNLIVSLWQVSDASTAQLMIEFYRQHLQHADQQQFSSALRQAKLSLLHSEAYQAPYYWAPFILIGE